MPLPGAEAELGQAVLAQCPGGRPGTAARREHPADPAQRAERMGQRHDLAGAADPAAGHGRDQARIEDLGEPLAQRRDTPASPDRNVRSRTAISARASASSSHGGPPVALASSRLRWCSRCSAPVSRTPDSAPMPVFTPYTGAARAQHGTCLAAALIHRQRQFGREPEPAPGGDLADRPGAEVGRRAQGAGRAAQVLDALLRNRCPIAVG